MSNVSPTQASGSASPTSGLSQTPTGTVVGASGGAAAPPVGTVLNGVIAVQQPGGIAAIRLDNGGTIQVRTAFPLPANGQIALQIAASGPPAQFVLLSVNEHPVGRTSVRSAAATPPAAGGGQGAAESSAANMPPLGQGRVVTATVARIEAPIPGAGTASSGSAAATPAASSPGAAPTAVGPVAAASIATRLAVGTQLEVRVLALAGARPLAAEAGRAVIQGTVGPATPGGRTVVRAPFGILSLAAGAAPAPGSPITLEVIGPVRPAPPPSQAAAAPPGPALLSHDWGALREALQALSQIDPGLAQAVLDNVVPQPGPKLAASMLFLIAALRAGNVRGWLGDAASQALERGAGDRLLRRLGADFGALQRLAHDVAGEWRAFFIPIFDGELQQMRLFVHHREHPDGEDAAEDPGQRFVVEVDLSRLGPLQLDGLIRKRRFDLILRSQRPLGERMRDDITRIFTGAAEAGGMGGGITFQTLPSFPVAPLKELSVQATEVVV